MNPEETNPMANPGAAGTGGMSSGPVDFTANNDARLSMADSLASAEDNLTSAGLAAKTSGSDAIGLDQIGASDPTATMARPDEPLTPAAPMPGSIGSAMSGPSLDSAPLTMPSASASASGATPVNPFASSAAGTETSATPTLSTTPATPAMPAVPVANSQTAPVASATPATSGASEAMPMMSSTSSQNPGYNPFAMSEPAPVQPKVDMGAAMRDKKKPNVLMVVLIGLVAVLAVAVVVLAVLWQQAVNNPTIKYVTQQPVEEQPVAEDVTLVCSRTMGAEEAGGEAMVGLTSVTETDRMSYVAGTLSSVTMTQNYLFADAMAAQGMAPMFDQIVAGMPGTANYVVNDMTVDFSVELSGDQLGGWTLNQGQTAEGVSLISLGVDEAKANLEGQGYTCFEE